MEDGSEEGGDSGEGDSGEGDSGEGDSGSEYETEDEEEASEDEFEAADRVLRQESGDLGGEMGGALADSDEDNMYATSDTDKYSEEYVAGRGALGPRPA